MEEAVDAGWWTEPDQQQLHLFEPPPVSTPLFFCEPDKIRVQRVGVTPIVHLQREMSRVRWNASPGRKMGFVVLHEDSLLGIGFLTSPVFCLTARDEFLNLPKDNTEKGRILRGYADLSVCVGAQPFAWHWNAGKLIASLATTLGDFWRESYGDELVGLTTTSVWGRGSQYNRLWKFLGYTKGYGHVHVPDHVYWKMIDWMKKNGVERTPRAQSHRRMRNIGRFRRAVNGNTPLHDFHGEKRGIYYAPAVSSEQRSEVIHAWYERWGLPRYERTKDQEPPYTTGLAA